VVIAAVGAVSALGLLSTGCKSSSHTGDPALYDPSKASEQAPDRFSVDFDTTAGAFTVTCTRSWAPNGVDRFYNLVKIGFYDDVAFFRVVAKPVPFVAQFGLHGNPDVTSEWEKAKIAPDTPTQSNTRGRLTFAMAGSPDTRTTQLFFNLRDNVRLDAMGFAPICEVDGTGMSVVDKFDSEYGEKPDQGQITREGDAYLKRELPNLDRIKTARIAEKSGGASK
jgi:peptidyl-prolyl cis-trans isomerase A (cyclophilin A)